LHDTQGMFNVVRHCTAYGATLSGQLGETLKAVNF